MERKVKGAVKEIGGSVYSLGLFLSITSKDSVVSMAIGINRRVNLFIARSKLNSDLIQLLDNGRWNYNITLFITKFRREPHPIFYKMFYSLCNEILLVSLF